MAVPGHTVVVGAGLAGLSATWQLARALPSCKITLLESSRRTGGWVETTRADHRLFDRGPHSIRPGALNYSMCEMVSQLGLSDQVITGDPQAQFRYLYHKGQLRRLPNGLRDVLTNSGVFGRGLLKAVLREPRIPPRLDGKDETVHEFMSRRFGQEIADTLITAMVHGIYAGDAKQVSIQSCFPPLYEGELRAGSVVRSMLKRGKPPDMSKYDASTKALIERVKGKGMWSFKGGMGVLTDTLEREVRAMPNVQLLEESPCESVQIAEKSIQVKPKGSTDALTADRVVCALSARKLADVLSFADDARASASRITNILRSIPFGTVAVVNVAYDRDVLPFKGFGYLVPQGENVPELGVIFDSCAFPDQDAPGTPGCRLTVMMGGHRFNELFGAQGPDEATMKSLAQTVLRERLGITDEPTDCLARVQWNCIPQYPPGHSDRMKELDWLLRQKDLRGRLSVLGCSYLGVSVNDVVRISRHTANEIALGRPATGLVLPS